jgi:DNA-binding CsgD family transcriptional regulator
MLRRISGVKDEADMETLLGDLAELLGYRSGYLLDFPNDATAPIQLWDSDPARAAWWREQTGNGTHSISRSLAEVLEQRGVQRLEVKPDDPRYDFAVTYDFDSTTVVPVTFDSQTRGVASFSGRGADDIAEIALSLQVVCYALLMQARSLGAQVTLPSVTLTPREREVMALSAEGMTSDGVAGRLSMSPRTVNQHLDNVATKLKTRNRVHTVAEAIRRGLLS